MGAQTAGTVADWGQIFLTPNSGSTLAALPNPQSLDLLQIFGQGGKCLIKVSSAGTVSKNPVTHTTEVLFGRYQSRLASTASTASTVWSASTRGRPALDGGLLSLQPLQSLPSLSDLDGCPTCPTCPTRCTGHPGHPKRRSTLYVCMCVCLSVGSTWVFMMALYSSR